VSVRPTQAGDAGALAEIYAHAVLHGSGTFEEAPPAPAEMESRRLRVIAHGLPHLVTERDGVVAGFAYAAPFRSRPAYRFTAETTVYVREGLKGRGVGRELLEAVVVACATLGLRQLVALVGDSDNTASLRLHAAAGFHRVGVLEAVGFKHGRWLDAVWMQREINGGDRAPPSSSGLLLEET
jgi:phosphinothricin acetyltransferase